MNWSGITYTCWSDVKLFHVTVVLDVWYFQLHEGVGATAGNGDGEVVHICRSARYVAKDFQMLANDNTCS